MPRPPAGPVLVALAAACGGGGPPAQGPEVLANHAEPPPAPVAGVQYVGNPDAAVVVTYFFDYACPPCRQASLALDEIEQRYGDRIVVRYLNFPLPSHPDGRTAAIAAEAARRQDRFIEMHRALVRGAPSLAPADLRGYASSLGLDMDRFDLDVADPAAGQRIDAEIAQGTERRLDFVPAVFVDDILLSETTAEAIGLAIDGRMRAVRSPAR